MKINRLPYILRLMKNLLYAILISLTALQISCTADPARETIRVILDTDANNEIDDQNAIAYLLFNGDTFDVEGITVNRTRNGGDIHAHVAEAERVVRLTDLEGDIPVLRGASGSFEEIRPHLDENRYDGQEAVRFIIEQAHKQDDRKLILLPVGKLTNIALALQKDPTITDKVQVVWLGSNYPERGEYNKENDPESLTYILDETDVHFEMVTVRYREPSGTDAVRVTPEDLRERVSGLGPVVTEPVVGRNGGEFTTFGDYSVNLIENINLHGDPPGRALYDMAAVAIVKNPQWADVRVLPAPQLEADRWSDRPENPRTILLWENFDRDAIMEDFYRSFENYVLAR